MRCNTKQSIILQVRHNKASPALTYFTDKDILCHPSFSKIDYYYYYYYIHTDRCGNTYRQKSRAKRRRKEIKYRILCMEICRMWNRKCMVIPVVTGATEMAAKIYRKI